MKALLNGSRSIEIGVLALELGGGAGRGEDHAVGDGELQFGAEFRGGAFGKTP
jgi:hypothetical protein